MPKGLQHLANVHLARPPNGRMTYTIRHAEWCAVGGSRAEMLSACSRPVVATGCLRHAEGSTPDAGLSWNPSLGRAEGCRPGSTEVHLVEPSEWIDDILRRIERFPSRLATSISTDSGRPLGVMAPVAFGTPNIRATKEAFGMPKGVRYRLTVP